MRIYTFRFVWIVCSNMQCVCVCECQYHQPEWNVRQKRLRPTRLYSEFNPNPTQIMCVRQSHTCSPPVRTHSPIEHKLVIPWRDAARALPFRQVGSIVSSVGGTLCTFSVNAVGRHNNLYSPTPTRPQKPTTQTQSKRPLGCAACIWIYIFMYSCPTIYI